MAPRRKRLKFGTLGELISLSFSDWEAIRKSSGIDFKNPEIARLNLAIMALSYTGDSERDAPYKNSLVKIKKLAKLVASLRQDFPSVNYGQFVKDIDKNLEYVTRTKTQFALVGPAFLLESFSHLLRQVDAIVGNVLTCARESPGGTEIREGDNWDLWIRVITNILTNAGLSTKVRKDEGDLKKTSPFVIFVREIQKRLPQHLFKKRSDEALATAISRAQKGYGKLSKAEVDTTLKMWLGAYRPIFGKNTFHAQIDPHMDRNISRLLKEGDR